LIAVDKVLEGLGCRVIAWDDSKSLPQVLQLLVNQMLTAAELQELWAAQGALLGQGGEGGVVATQLNRAPVAMKVSTDHQPDIQSVAVRPACHPPRCTAQ
jgi:hypothetical protein